MNYHNILHDDMLNGEGLRVVLFVSGCSHQCPNCQNPQTHPLDSGIPFTDKERDEIFYYLSKPYIKGITFSGGSHCDLEQGKNFLGGTLNREHSINRIRKCRLYK